MQHPAQLPGDHPQLTIRGTWETDGRTINLWDQHSRAIIAAAKRALEEHLRPYLFRSCTHLKGNGGAKGLIREVRGALPAYPFVARFDVASFYETISHEVLLAQLAATGCPPHLMEIVRQYLARPDVTRSGVGLTAGGSLSPLLGAVYLSPLDAAFDAKNGDLLYRRYMDDIVILATTRRQLRMAIKVVHRVLNRLHQKVHTRKRFIGRTTRGFALLGYELHPRRRLRASAESIRRLTMRARRLYEQGASQERLWQYVSRWCTWLWGGVSARVSRKGGIWTYWVRVANEIGLVGENQPLAVHSPCTPI